MLWQALRGRSITAHDGWTLAPLAVLVIAVTVAAAVTVRADRRSPRAGEPRPEQTPHHATPSVVPATNA